MKTLKIFSAIALIAVLMSSCATLMTGTKSGISVKGTPEGAKVYQSGSFEGEAPLRVRVSKKAMKSGQTTIKIEKEGYMTQEVEINRKVRVGAIIANVVFTGVIIGNVIDFATGAIYKPHPGNIKYKLTPKSQSNPKLKVGDKVIFTTDKYENAEGEIKAIFPNRALIKATVQNNKLKTNLEGEEYSEIEVEVPFVNIAKK
jgi:hypothetical protein